MLTQHQLHWVNVLNDTSEEIPPFALLRVTGLEADTNAIKVAKPNASSDVTLMVNGPLAIPVGGYGSATEGSPVPIAYNILSGVPVEGEVWGSSAGSWLATKNRTGYTVRGVASGRVVVASRTMCCNEATGTGTGTGISENPCCPNPMSETLSLTLCDKTGLYTTFPDTITLTYNATYGWWEGTGTDTDLKSVVASLVCNGTTGCQQLSPSADFADPAEAFVDAQTVEYLSCDCNGFYLEANVSAGTGLIVKGTARFVITEVGSEPDCAVSTSAGTGTDAGVCTDATTLNISWVGSEECILHPSSPTTLDSDGSRFTALPDTIDVVLADDNTTVVYSLRYLFCTSDGWEAEFVGTVTTVETFPEYSIVVLSTDPLELRIYMLDGECMGGYFEVTE